MITYSVNITETIFNETIFMFRFIIHSVHCTHTVVVDEFIVSGALYSHQEIVLSCTITRIYIILWPPFLWGRGTFRLQVF